MSQHYCGHYTSVMSGKEVSDAVCNFTSGCLTVKTNFDETNQSVTIL